MENTPHERSRDDRRLEMLRRRKRFEDQLPNTGIQEIADIILVSWDLEEVSQTEFEKFIIQQFVTMAEESLDPEQFDRLKGMVWSLCTNRSHLDEEFHTEVCTGEPT